MPNSGAKRLIQTCKYDEKYFVDNKKNGKQAEMTVTDFQFIPF
jgi:hypothetical protein